MSSLCHPPQGGSVIFQFGKPPQVTIHIAGLNRNAAVANLAVTISGDVHVFTRGINKEILHHQGPTAAMLVEVPGPASRGAGANANLLNPLDAHGVAHGVSLRHQVNGRNRPEVGRGPGSGVCGREEKFRPAAIAGGSKFRPALLPAPSRGPTAR